MEISPIEVVNDNVKKYVDYIFNYYIINVTYPIDSERYKDWFMCEFLPCCITRWHEPSCYDINNVYTIDEFFDNSINVFSEILQILSDYFDCDNMLALDSFNPENVMIFYTNLYISNNVEYFLDRYKYSDYVSDESNNRSDTSEILSIDLFQSNENILVENNHEIETEIETENVTEIPHFVGDEDTIDEGETDDETTNSSLPTLINIVDDDDDDNDDGDGDDDNDDNDNELYETGVFVTEDVFNEKNKNEECVICWNVVMNHYNSMKWNNCDHFTCINCHYECMTKRLHRCPLCRM